MAEASIPVDLFNPGQVFACLGFLEAAETVLGEAQGGFDWSEKERVRFCLRAKGAENPFKAALRFVSLAKLHSEAPCGSDNETEKWDVKTVRLGPDDPFPIPDPASPATLPAVLVAPSESGSTARLVIDHWGEGDATGRDDVKFWAGAAGYPGAALVKDAIDLVRDDCVASASEPFSLAAGQSSSFRFDWRRDYIPMDIGFSLNRHQKMEPVGFPLVELFAAIGLGNARPKRVDKVEYVYAAMGDAGLAFHDPIFLRAALGTAELPFPRRQFRMRLGWPGQEGQARAITTVTEERVK